MLRRRRRDVDDRRGCQEAVRVDRDVKEDLAQNVDIEVVVDEVLEVDVPQLSKTMSKRTMKLAKSMSEVDARQNREVDMDLVEKEDVKEVGNAMVMCRCGWGGWSLCMGRGASGVTMALLPCQIVLGFHLKGVPRWVDQKSLGCHVVAVRPCMVVDDSCRSRQ